MKTASERIKLAQGRYKADFDAHIRIRNQDIKPGDMVYVRRERGQDGSKNKLMSPSTGPYPVLKKSSHTVVIRDDDGLEKIPFLWTELSRHPDLRTKALRPDRMEMHRLLLR